MNHKDAKNAKRKSLGKKSFLFYRLKILGVLRVFAVKDLLLPYLKGYLFDQMALQRQRNGFGAGGDAQLG